MLSLPTLKSTAPDWLILNLSILSAPSLRIIFFLFLIQFSPLFKFTLLLLLAVLSQETKVLLPFINRKFVFQYYGKT